jgi:hypothetical protein
MKSFKNYTLYRIVRVIRTRMMSGSCSIFVRPMHNGRITSKWTIKKYAVKL